MKVFILILIIALSAWIIPPAEKSTIPADISPVTIDGPYVLYRADSIIVQYMDSSDGRLTVRSNQWQLSQKEQVQLIVNTDEAGKSLNIKLRSKLSPEKSSYGKPKKMMVMSDIEGNFPAISKLLRGNGVIDENYKWTFGDGHLVLVGDFVDRGNMVTEVLWLIYSLESQAEASGGKVHFILGNHEIMNMNGDHKYVHPRYMAHADSMRVNYLDLFGNKTELGRWLSTKNVTERIGNILFMHGGFSAYMNQAQMQLNAINDTARLYYSDTSFNYPGIYSELLFSDFGPFWYRGYYHGNIRATPAQVDSTLSLYDCRFIVTGHTIIANEIVSVFDGKVIDTDVHHKNGHSEALWIEGNKMYRVNSAGEQMKINSLK